MTQIRTDLAYEAHQNMPKSQKGSPDGITFEEYHQRGINATKIEILNQNAEKLTGKPQGKYITVKTERDLTPQLFKEYSQFLAQRIRELLPQEHENILIAGLGNRFITADSIGPKAISHIIVTRHIKSICPAVYKDLSLSDVAALAPGVLSQTGIESGDIIRSIIDDIRPECLIVIDALAARTLSHLACMIQLSDYGIQPGSGVNNSRTAINREKMGVPVISIGVPTVVDASALAFEMSKKLGTSVEKTDELFSDSGFECFFTLKESDLITDNMARLIGYSVNMALHSGLSYEEMLSMCS